MADIFLSYARDDRVRAQPVAAALEAAGYSVWWDSQLATGQRYLKETEAQLKAARAVVVLWSAKSVESHSVADEAMAGRDAGKLAPISIDGTMPPLGFRQFQVTDFSKWTGGVDEAPFPMLLAAIGKLAAPSGEAKPAPKAKEKKRGGALAAVLALVVVAAAAVGGGYWWMTQQPRQAAASAPAVAEAKASVAVLPFKDLSAAGDEAHLANGMSVEILSDLRRIDKLTVAGGDSMARMVEELKGDPKAIGERLSVAHLLEGDVRKDGDQLRISARLIRASDGHIAWSEQYDRATSGIFEVQDDIASKVAGALSVVLDVGLQSTSHGGTTNFEAYDHYLRGRLLRNTRPAERPVQELEQSVALDPNYARAWAELTIAYGGVARIAPTPEAFAAAVKKMDEASANAERLAPDMWFAHTSRGWFFLASNDWERASDAHKRAAEIAVPDPELYSSLSSFAGQVGRASEVERLREMSRSVDPSSTDRDTGAMLNNLALKRPAEAWAAYERAKISAPQQAFLREAMAPWAALADGRVEEAKAIMRQKDLLGVRYTEIADKFEKPAEVLAIMRASLANPAAQRGELSAAALFAGYFGDTELAVQLLRRAYLGPGWAGQYMTWFPQLHEARKTDAFKQFVRDMGWEKMYRASGDWGDFCRPAGETDFTCE